MYFDLLGERMKKSKVLSWLFLAFWFLAGVLVLGPMQKEEAPRVIEAAPAPKPKPPSVKIPIIVQTRIYIKPRIIEAKKNPDGTIRATIKVDMPPVKKPLNAFVEFDVQEIHKLDRLECDRDLIYAYMRKRNSGEQGTTIRFDRRTHPELFKNSVLDQILVVERPTAIPRYY